MYMILSYLLLGSSTRIARLRSGFGKELNKNRNEINKENGESFYLSLLSFVYIVL